MKTKKCSRCKQVKSIDLFPKNKSRKDGYHCYCKKCYKEIHDKWVEEHRENTRIAAKKQYYDKTEQKKSYARKQYYDNKEKALERVHLRYENKKDEIKAYIKQWRKDNIETCRKYSKNYASRYPDKKRVINARYRRNNRDKLNAKEIKRYRTIRKLPFTLTVQQWEECRKHFNYKCAYCGKEVDNLTIDHFIPVSKNGELSKNNVIPCCLSCNSSKCNKDFFEWYKKQPFYTKTREQKILKYLNYKNGIQQTTL